MQANENNSEYVEDHQKWMLSCPNIIKPIDYRNKLFYSKIRKKYHPPLSYSVLMVSPRLI